MQIKVLKYNSIKFHEIKTLHREAQRMHRVTQRKINP
jgi:hypothetical protein